jgi:hypothetical protein
MIDDSRWFHARNLVGACPLLSARISKLMQYDRVYSREVYAQSYSWPAVETRESVPACEIWVALAEI